MTTSSTKLRGFAFVTTESLRPIGLLLLSLSCGFSGIHADTPQEVSENSAKPLEELSTSELIDAAIAGWEGLASNKHTMKTTIEIERTRDGNGEDVPIPNSFRRLEISKDGDQVKAEVLRESGFRGVLAVNTEYVFSMQRSSDSELGPSLNFVEPVRQAQEDIGEMIEEYRWLAIRDVFASCHFLGRPAFEWFRDPLMKVDHVEFSTTGLERVATFYFTYGNEDDKINHLGPSTLVCDPAHEWRIMSVDAKRSWGTVAIDVTYSEDETTEFNFLPTKIVEKLVSKNGSETRVALISEFSQEETPASEFMVSTYGIPEPTFQSSRSWIVTLLVLNGLFLVLISYYLSKRRRKAE